MPEHTARSETKDLVLRGADVGGRGRADILVRAGRIVAIGARAAGEARAGADVLDADGLVALPGLVDLHTHLRQPGGEDAETILTGSRAAASGGYTCVHAMANTSPVADDPTVVDRVWELGRDAGLVEVRPVGAVTRGLAGEHLAPMGALAASRARVTVFSDDGRCVADPVLMRRALEYAKAFGAVVAQHEQDPELTDGAQMHESALSGELGLKGWPAVAEESMIARDILLARGTGSRLHICHVSTAESVELIRWGKKQGVAVSAEVTPHHLALTEECAATYDPRYKVNPPLRSAEDVEALRQGLADGTIDAVATDHAPHPAEAKDCEWQAGAFGVTGLETALPIVFETMVRPGRWTWEDVERAMSTAPAAIGRVAGQGRPLKAGEPANIALFDPSARWVVSRETQQSRSLNTPFLGRELTGRVVDTLLRGRLTVRDSKPVDRAQEAKEERA